MASYSTSSEWFGFFGPTGEPQQDVSPSKETIATASSRTSGSSSKEQPVEWPLDDIMNDIEQQMNEQNDHLAGMTRQLEDIEHSLAQHGSSSARSKRSVVKKKTSTYVQMSDDEDDSLACELELEAQPGNSKPSILRVLKKKASQVVRGNSHDEEDEAHDKDRPLSRADPGSRYDLEVATTASSSTRRANNSTRRPNSDSASDLTPPRDTQHSRRHLKLHPILSKLPTQQQERPPPPTTVNGSTSNHGNVKVNFAVGDGHKRASLRSSTTWEGSDSSSNPESDDVSELENTTISGSKTWVTLRGSRKVKFTLLFLSFALALMIGLLMGQWAQRRDVQATQQQNQQAPTLQPVAGPDAGATGETTTEGAPDSTASEPTTSFADNVQDDPATENGDGGSAVVQGYDYTANSNYLVGVYYYPWHGENFHNDGGYMRQDLTPQHQPALGEYNDSDPAVIAQHMKWFRQANIGLLVTSWWGPNRLEDSNTKDVIMEHEDVGNLKIALHYETTNRLGDGRDRIGNAKTDIEYMCEHYFNHPNYYKIDGRPVIFIYVSRKLHTVGTLEEALLTMRSTANKCGTSLYLIGDSVFESAPTQEEPYIPFWYFDAVTNYDVYGSAGRPEGYVGYERVDSYYQQQAEWKKQAEKENCHYIPAVSPGYNDRAVRMEKDHPPLSRRITADAEEGSLLHYQLQQAKELVDPKMDKMILVNSFNEWHEDTVRSLMRYLLEIDRAY
ncbi:MAG: hypothetical protein SGILL_004179 [Bacillariaceae sp.]